MRQPQQGSTFLLKCKAAEGEASLRLRKSRPSIAMAPCINNTASFEFNATVSGEQMSPADELFYNGTIRATSPSPSYCYDHKRIHRVSRSVSPPHSDKSYWEAYARIGILDEKVPACDTSGKSPKHARKWSLKDMLLPRSRSEGSNKDEARLKDRVKDHQNERPGVLPKVNNLFQKNRKSCSTGSISLQSSPNRWKASPHEMHYTANRAYSESIKKKTSLPYRQGVLACLGFPPSTSSPMKGVVPV